MAEPLAPFADGLLDSLAADRNRDAARLRELVRTQQRLLRDFPDLTVEALVHDWRVTFQEDPLVATDDAAFYCSVGEHVWADLVDRMDLEERDAELLRAVNAAQFERAVGTTPAEVAVVLAR